LQISLQAASPEIFGYTLVYFVCRPSGFKLSYSLNGVLYASFGRKTAFIIFLTIGNTVLEKENNSCVANTSQFLYVF
jgi:hypothetical protein